MQRRSARRMAACSTRRRTTFRFAEARVKEEGDIPRGGVPAQLSTRPSDVACPTAAKVCKFARMRPAVGRLTNFALLGGRSWSGDGSPDWGFLLVSQGGNGPNFTGCLETRRGEALRRRAVAAAQRLL